MKTNWDGRKIFTLEFRRMEKAIRDKMANKLYYFIKNLPNFPFDKTETASSHDPRKTPPPAYHLRQQGAGFVGSEQRVGPHFSGTVPNYKEGTVSVIFSAKKEQLHRVFDYADMNLQKILYVQPTRSEVKHILNKVIAEVGGKK